MFARLTCQAITKRAADGNPLAVTPKTRFNVCRVLTVEEWPVPGNARVRAIQPPLRNLPN
jgi:hypothetical protein